MWPKHLCSQLLTSVLKLFNHLHACYMLLPARPGMLKAPHFIFLHGKCDVNTFNELNRNKSPYQPFQRHCTNFNFQIIILIRLIIIIELQLPTRLIVIDLIKEQKKRSNFTTIQLLNYNYKCVIYVTAKSLHSSEH